jgi:hypothetical protein
MAAGMGMERFEDGTTRVAVPCTHGTVSRQQRGPIQDGPARPACVALVLSTHMLN